MAQAAGITTTGCSVGPKISPTCHDARWIAADFLETIIGLDNGEVARCNHVKPQLTAQIFNKEGIVATGRVNAIKCTTPTVACRFPRPRLSASLRVAGAVGDMPGGSMRRCFSSDFRTVACTSSTRHARERAAVAG